MGKIKHSLAGTFISVHSSGYQEFRIALIKITSGYRMDEQLGRINIDNIKSKNIPTK